MCYNILEFKETTDPVIWFVALSRTHRRCSCCSPPFTDLSEHSLLLQSNWLPSRCICYAQLEFFLGFDAHRSSNESSIIADPK